MHAMSYVWKSYLLIHVLTIIMNEEALTSEGTHCMYISDCMHAYLLDISRQLACMKLGSREKYQPTQYCWVHISRLLGYLVSYVPFAYRYPTNLLSVQTGRVTIIC